MRFLTATTFKLGKYFTQGLENFSSTKVGLKLGDFLSRMAKTQVIEGHTLWEHKLMLGTVAAHIELAIEGQRLNE